jgi:hypothetical protein
VLNEGERELIVVAKRFVRKENKVFCARREAKDGPKEFDEAQLKDVEVARIIKEMAVGKNFGMNVCAFFKDTVKRVANEGLNGDFVVRRDMMKAFEEGIDPR